MIQHFRPALAAVALFLGTWLPATFAAQTDISSSPLQSTTSAQVKPNIMLLMDTSGSMGWGHMPDEVESVDGVGSIGYKSAQCNVLYYNPNTTYQLPKKYDGTYFPAPTIDKAPYAGYVSYYVSSDAIDLSVRDLTEVGGTKGFQAYDTKTTANGAFADTSQPGYYYVYTGTQTPSYASAPCTDKDTGVTKAATGGGTWTRYDVRDLSAKQQSNFAIWYSYYRIRISLIKSAASLAFTPLTDTFRVGFLTVFPKDARTDTSINPAKYLAISDFNSTQRSAWFSKLFSQRPGGASPTREGLARAGRMYAGRHDSINAGMDDDPVQYSCQQNFTILTTDGYWNAQTESPRGGPVGIDGTTLVGQEDGTLNASTRGIVTSPRPIYDGATDGIGITDYYTDSYSYAACGAFAYRTTSQTLKTVAQVRKSTSQVTQSTSQIFKHTNQILQSTSQVLKSTAQTTVSTNQNLQSTEQNLKSTNQVFKTTSQSIAKTSQPTQTVQYVTQTQTQNLRSTVQNLQSTTQTTKSTSQILTSTTQNFQSTNQNLQSTTQTVQTTAQILQSTSKASVSTSQITITTSQVQQSTLQTRSCDATTELCKYVAPGTCVAVGYTYCDSTATGPTLVATCNAQEAALSNNYQQVTCSTTTNGPTGTAACTPSSATASNSYTTTTCSNVNTGPTVTASCTPATASAGNRYTTTTCTYARTGPTGVDSCTPVSAGPPSYVATTCATNNTSGAVASCTPSSASASNGYTTTTCGTVTTTNVPVATCTPSSPSSSNSFTTTTCSSNTTTKVPVATCTAALPTAANSYTTVTCPAAEVHLNKPSLACTAATPTSSNSYIATTCSTSTSGPTAVQTCTPVLASADPTFTATTCGNNNTTDVAVNSCSPSSASASNGWKATTCSTNNTTEVPVPSCTAASAALSNSWTTTTCPSPKISSSKVASCTPASATSTNSYTATTCATTVLSGPTVVASCSPVAASSSNGFQATVCGTQTSSTPSGTCVPQLPTASNGYKTITCSTATSPEAAAQTCTPASASASNSWTTTTCRPVVTTNVAVQTCTLQTATASNSWVTITCGTNNTTNVPVATCTASAATSTNSWTKTTCPPPVKTGPTGTSSCSDVTANSGNNYTSTTCGTNNTSSVPVATCTASGPTPANAYTTTTCPAPIVTTSVPVANCTAATASSSNTYTTTTCGANTTPEVAMPSCAYEPASSSNGQTETICRTATIGPAVVPACNPIAASTGNNYLATTCGTALTGPTPFPSCVPSGPSSANNYTTTTCDSGASVTDQAAASCASQVADGSNGYTNITCRTATTGPDLLDAASCIAATPVSSNSYTATLCAATQGKKLQYTTKHAITNQLYSGGIKVGVPTYPSPQPADGAPTDVDSTCYQPNTEPEPPVAPSVAPGLPALPLGCTSWTTGCVSMSSTASGGSVNSLADVAQYYYVTDLRPASAWPASIANDNVPSVGTGPEDDRVNWQHMTTFTIGLGVSGTLNYQPDYLSAKTGDFASIRSGAIGWPVWPDPTLDYTSTAKATDNWNNPRSIDDFWHTAVNGRGKYFSASDPTSVIAGLSGALIGVKGRASSGSAAGITTAQPVEKGDNRVYISQYTTSEWTGELQSFDLDLTTGLPTATPYWSAQSLLDAKTGSACDGRNIYLMRSGNTLVNFSYAGSITRCDGAVDSSPGLNATEQANFAAANVQLLSQWPSMTLDQQAAAPGNNLVNFLRGQRGFEGFIAGDDKSKLLYRTRKHVLGDIVNAQPVLVKAPSFGYSDSGYGAFAVANANRTPMVYAAANDGMLHAFYAGADSKDALGGQEAWAVIPSSVLPALYRLADDNYGNVHQFTVDGTPVVADVHGSSGWRTVLVAGLNDGGKGYYALDVTDPSTPQALWEFKAGSVCHGSAAVGYTDDCYVGYSFGKPVVSKLANGTWVVMFTSGYNNVAGGAGDGQGYLYVVNALTGALISRISTGAGSASTPSGLAQINNYVENGAVDNTTVHVYGGDLLGNVWRFNINDTLDATRLGTAQDKNGLGQPITVRPELAELNGKPMVLVGTGRLLGASDITNLQVQSVYGIVDQLTGDPVYTDLRRSLAPLVMTLSKDGLTRNIACTTDSPLCSSAYGWYFDFSPDSTATNVGERVNVQMSLLQGTLVVGSNVPQSSACTTGGYSWLTYVDYSSGLAVASSDGAVVSSLVGPNSLLVGLDTMLLPGGKYRVLGRVAGQAIDGTVTPPDPKNKCVPDGKSNVACEPPVDQTTPPGRRISWREIVQ